MDWFTGPVVVFGIAIFLAIAGLIALGVRHLEARSRRDEEAARLQQALAEPLAREPLLASCSVLPVTTLPTTGRPRVEVTGWVRSKVARDAAMRAVERQAARLGRRVQLVDRLEVVGSEEATRRTA
jgi:hypothetical protein